MSTLHENNKARTFYNTKISSSMLLYYVNKICIVQLLLHVIHFNYGSYFASNLLVPEA